MARFQPLIAAAVGGALGSLLRWAAVASVADGLADLTVLGLNIVGSLLLGLLVGSGDRLSENLFVLLGTGLAGGLTTFSTFAVAVAARLEDGRLLSASGFGLGTLLATLVAAGVGYRIGRSLSPAGGPSPDRVRR
jgi:CrcB protein